ncbi:hypothetical protein P171DRAFT_521374 [Karstenula rhodostoma CBS 690.94]|uniref:BTB domain-containing protein n=1 Tax=Karstenula rhodostoma CBS 690.94 TaxID=1392251 RepID=A0A9P4PIK1_9PLEO|nr:hypothetical protein P171DRAFT_521374 [Karstenula rhodostoma CBS 690.94]
MAPARRDGHTNSDLDPTSRVYTLVVHDGEHRLHVHESILCQSSEFLKAAVKSEWKTLRENQNEIDLTDDHIDLFKVYVHWLHNKDQRLVLLRKHVSGVTYEEEIDQFFAAELYAFGEKILDRAFSDAVFKFGFTSKIGTYTPYQQKLCGEVAAILCEAAPEVSFVQTFVIYYFL